MIKVEKFQTFDGKLHSNTKDAKKHLDALYANKLCVISSSICYLNGKHVPTGDWIDQNLHLFLELAQIKDDQQLAEEDGNGN